MRHDSTLYTAQALNILYPEIYQEDIFFKYGSQASFTFFPRLHALLIEYIGVDASAFILTIIGQALFFVGSISLTRHFLTSGQTILFLVILTTLPTYNNPVLYIFEVFSTSRTIAAGLSLIFLTLILKNRIIVASVVLIMALLLHPLVPLGVIAIALFLQRPKVIAIVITLGFVSLVICYVLAIPPVTQLSLIIDNEWRNLVAQRAPFLFMHLWLDDDLSLLFLELCIILSARAYCADKLRQIFNAVLLATSACLLTSLISSWLSNTLLIQLQTWRILLFVHIFSAIAFAWLISAAWKSNNGKVVILLYCTIFLSFSAIGGLPALAVHIFWVYSLKRHLILHPLAIKGAFILLAQGVFWYILNTEYIDPFTFTNNPTFELFSNIKHFLETSPFYVSIFLFAILIYSNHLKKAFSIFLSVAILSISPIAIFYFDQRDRTPTWDIGNYEPYITLREEIPEDASVYCEQGVEACWFVLRRQNYMSPYQTAGIVFSRKTAFEAKRRADLLFNAGFNDGVFPRHWSNGRHAKPPKPTVKAFDLLCQDPVLDYIITGTKTLPKIPDKIINANDKRLKIYYCFDKDHQTATPDVRNTSTVD
jgi:hypothetical protein